MDRKTVLEIEPQPGGYYLIFDNGWYLATYIINGEFQDSDGENFHPDYYYDLDKII